MPSVQMRSILEPDDSGRQRVNLKDFFRGTCQIQGHSPLDRLDLAGRAMPDR